MAQLNVAIDDALATAADRLASVMNMSRPDLVRFLLREAIAAEKEGRPLLTQSTKPTDPAALAELAHRMNQQAVDLDRILRDHDKRAARLEKTHQSGEDAVLLAQERLAKILRTHLDQGYQPFQKLIVQLQADFDSRAEQLQTAILEQPHLDQITTRLDRLDESVREGKPSVHHHWAGYGFSWAGWGLVGLVGFAVYTLLLLVLAKSLPAEWIANPLSHYAFGSNDRAICSLYQNSTGSVLCPVLSEPPLPAKLRRAAR